MRRIYVEPELFWWPFKKVQSVNFIDPHRLSIFLSCKGYEDVYPKEFVGFFIIILFKKWMLHLKRGRLVVQFVFGSLLLPGVPQERLGYLGILNWWFEIPQLAYWHESLHFGHFRHLGHVWNHHAHLIVRACWVCGRFMLSSETGICQ